ncbi:MAG: hypothetical protein CL932_23080, partial [Deltaproteobacteria bacterium]|nr:hypothetical protein [Deltaproteobacteria bacterium]
SALRLPSQTFESLRSYFLALRFLFPLKNPHSHAEGVKQTMRQHRGVWGENPERVWVANPHSQNPLLYSQKV